MNKRYRRLCASDRKVIHNMKKAGFTQQEIADVIGFSQSTVSKELSRNRGQRGYRPRQAQNLARERQASKQARPRVIQGEILREVTDRLRKNHSPDQISQRLVRKKMSVSHESIYRFVSEDRRQGGDLWRHLRINGKRRYRHRNKATRGEKIPQRTDIDERPECVAERARYGDWEADLMTGGSESGYLLSVYERKSRYGRLYHLPSKHSDETAIGLVMLLRNFQVKTITYDNGLEFARHQFVNDLLGSESFFCKPYSSWEKGGVENYNGLVRQYVPKGTDLNKISPKRLLEIESELNDRPRKVLGYDSPSERLDQLLKN